MQLQINILLIEDDSNYSQLLQRKFQYINDYEFDIKLSDCLLDGLNQLNIEDIDIVLLDLNLPDSWGIETFKKIYDNNSNTPIIILTGSDDKQMALEAIRLGAQDYLVKGELNINHLVRSVNYAIERNKIVKFNDDIKELNKDHKKFIYMLDNNIDGILVIDKNYTICYANKSAEKIYNQSSENLIGTPFGNPVVKGEKTEIETFDTSGAKHVVEMSVAEIVWEGETSYLASLRDISEHKKKQEALYALSNKDDVTGLYNRRGFQSLAIQHIKLAKQTKSGLIIVVLDIDGLKQINDRFGHMVGTKAIIETAEILQQTFRESDIISRLGGDEFVVLTTITIPDDFKVIESRLKKIIMDHNAKKDRPYNLSISMGTAHYDPINPVSLNELLNQADKSMYAYKNNKKIRNTLDFPNENVINIQQN